MLVFKLLSMWGIDGFKKHIAKVQQFYRQQRDFMLDAAIQHLTGICGVVVVGFSSRVYSAKGSLVLYLR